MGKPQFGKVVKNASRGQVQLAALVELFRQSVSTGRAMAYHFNDKLLNEEGLDFRRKAVVLLLPLPLVQKAANVLLLQFPGEFPRPVGGKIQRVGDFRPGQNSAVDQG